MVAKREVPGYANGDPLALTSRRPVCFSLVASVMRVGHFPNERSESTWLRKLSPVLSLKSGPFRALRVGSFPCLINSPFWEEDWRRGPISPSPKTSSEARRAVIPLDFGLSAVAALPSESSPLLLHPRRTFRLSHLLPSTLT